MSTGFWLVLALGVIVGAVGGYLVGIRKGRNW